MKKLLFLTIILVSVCFPQYGRAQNVLGQTVNFNIESGYDSAKRSQLSALLIKISPQAYWYLDAEWWQGMNGEQQSQVRDSLDLLAEEFETKIYPVLTSTFGSEWTPGIDKDYRITVLFHPMDKDAGGYNDTADEYPKIQIPESNGRELIYLNSRHSNAVSAKAFLAHELLHLITFNQKTKVRGVEEDIWLNEARAEYVPTLLGYDKDYEGSNLQNRVRTFLGRFSDSLTEWKGDNADYGVANLFIQYLADHYGADILIDSLKTRQVGIQSINTALTQRGYKTNFQQIFTDWTVAVLINNCKISEKYCYLNTSLKNFKLTPLMNYLPTSGQSTLSVNNGTKDWSGNWHRFVGGAGKLELEFQANDGNIFRIPYIIEDSAGNISVKELLLDKDLKGKIAIDDFGSEIVSLTIIPIAQNKLAGFSSLEPSRTFFWSAKTLNPAQANSGGTVLGGTVGGTSALREALIAELQARILAIQLEIVRLLQQLIQLMQSQLLTR